MKAKTPAAEFLAANEASFDVIHALAAEGLEHAGRLAALNLATVRAASADGARHVQDLLDVDDPSALMRLQSAGLEPQIAHAVAYVRDIGEIAADAHQQFMEITQGWIARIHASLGSAVGEASSGASAGSQALRAALESATEVASGLYDKVSESSVQALGAAEDPEGESAPSAPRRSARANPAAKQDSEAGAGRETGERVVSEGEH